MPRPMRGSCSCFSADRDEVAEVVKRPFHALMQETFDYGTLSDATMQSYGIPADYLTNRDNQPVFRKRALWVNHEHEIAQNLARHQSRLQQEASKHNKLVLDT